MGRNIDRLVAENRRLIRDVGTRVTEVDSNQDRDLSIGPSTIDVTADATLYTRPAGSHLLMGHPDDAHGFGRGTFGDDRGVWQAATDADVESTYTREGRRAVIRAIAGDVGGVTDHAAGTSTDTPTVGDDALTDTFATTPSANVKAATDTVDATSRFGAVEWVGDAAEFGVVDADGNLLSRHVVTGLDPIPNDSEVKIVTELTFAGSGIGVSTVTDLGDAMFANAMAFPGQGNAPASIAFGSGNDTFDKGDTDLSDEQFSKTAERFRASATVTVKTHVLEPEPSGNQPVTIGELAVKDDDGNMVWATPIQPFTKTDDIGFNAEVSFVTDSQ